MNQMYLGELLTLVKPLLKGFILLKGTLYVVQYLPYPIGVALRVLLTVYPLYPIYKDHKETVAEELGGFLRGLWDSCRKFWASFVEKVTAFMTDAAGFVKGLGICGGKLIQGNVLITWFSKLFQLATKMGKKVLVSIKTMATSVFSVGARFAAGVLSWFF